MVVSGDIPPIDPAKVRQCLLVPHIMGYRQVPAAMLLYRAHILDMKRITFDRLIATMCPWPEHVELLTP
jgi:hypothetical protein